MDAGKAVASSRQVPVPQTAHDFDPQDKLIEFLAGITPHLRFGAGVSSIEHLQDLNSGLRPLAKDAAVALGLGLERLAHFTTAGRRLAAWMSRRWPGSKRRSRLPIEQLQAAIARLKRLAQQQQTRRDGLRATHTRLTRKLYHARQTANGAISAKKLARWQAQTTGWQKRLPRLVEQIVQAQRVLDRHQARLTQLGAELTRLRAWQTQLQTDNQCNPNPLPHVTARMDVGIAAGENLTWLLEMGYRPDTKAANGQTTALRTHLPRGACWQQVGDNAKMVLVGEHQLHGCPYPMTVALERFQIGRNVKYATIVRCGPAPTLPVWFAPYNARQTIEAGSKEMKGVICVQHLTPAPTAEQVR